MKILIVDDSKAMRMIVTRALRQADLGDFELVEATNGAEALERAWQETPDLILADWNMPQMNGYELLQALRAKDPGVKLGFVTSEGTAEIRHAAMSAGALFLITKPFTPESFRTTLAPLVR